MVCKSRLLSNAFKLFEMRYLKGIIVTCWHCCSFPILTRWMSILFEYIDGKHTIIFIMSSIKCSCNAMEVSYIHHVHIYFNMVTLQSASFMEILRYQWFILDEWFIVNVWCISFKWHNINYFIKYWINNAVLNNVTCKGRPNLNIYYKYDWYLVKTKWPTLYISLFIWKWHVYHIHFPTPIYSHTLHNIRCQMLMQTMNGIMISTYKCIAKGLDNVQS